jgi:hypothetical protein
MSAFGGMRSSRFVVGVLLLACTLGARLPGAVHDPLWQDEIAAERVITQPTPRKALGQLVNADSNPPAFFLTAWAAYHTTNAVDSTVAPARSLRVLSIAFSLLMTALTFLLACELLPLWAAALAGLIVSFASELVAHGAELRPYAMLALACVAFAFVLERTVARPNRLRLALLAGVVAVGSLTHYFFLLTLAAGGLWLVTSGRERLLVRRIGVALAVGLVPLAVWSPYWLRQYHHGHYAWAPPFGWAWLASFLPTLFAPDLFVSDAGRAAQVAVSLAVIGSAVLLLRRREGRLYALLLLVPFLLAAMVWAAGARVFSPRNLIGIVPFAAIALSWACVSLPWRRISQVAAVMVGALLVGIFIAGQIRLERTPYDRIAHELIAQGFDRHEPIVWFGNYGGAIPVFWYLTSDGPTDLWPRAFIAKPTGSPCDAVDVVAHRGGFRWLYQHRADVLSETSVPFYSDSPRGKRAKNDLTIARLRWSRGILESAAAAHAFLSHRSDTPSPCLRP